jgi:malate dehydrogenase (oxaloacetate-decarboxylating)
VGSAIARLLLAQGVGRLLISDPRDEATAPIVAAGATATSLSDAMRHANVVVAATGRRGLIVPDLVRPGQVILALSNPEAEIDPEAAMAAGAAFAADGRAINNALAFPGIVRGMLDARATKLTTRILLVAAQAIAELAAPGALVPDVLSRAVHASVASAVAGELGQSTPQDRTSNSTAW